LKHFARRKNRARCQISALQVKWYHCCPKYFAHITNTGGPTMRAENSRQKEPAIEELLRGRGLLRVPFSPDEKSPDTFPVISQCEAATQLDTTAALRGVMVLAGSPGSGKSTLLKTWMRGLEPKRYLPPLITQASLSATGVLEILLAKLGERPRFKRGTNLLALDTGLFPGGDGGDGTGTGVAEGGALGEGIDRDVAVGGDAVGGDRISAIGAIEDPPFAGGIFPVEPSVAHFRAGAGFADHEADIGVAELVDQPESLVFAVTGAAFGGDGRHVGDVRGIERVTEAATDAHELADFIDGGRLGAGKAGENRFDRGHEAVVGGAAGFRTEIDRFGEESGPGEKENEDRSEVLKFHGL
jgi:energy-coupling factor transporter ATP-binding protein EcfA2